MNLVALQTKIYEDFDKNLKNLEQLILNCQQGDFILAPELAVTGYSYENMDKAVEFSKKAEKLFLQLSQDRTISVTLITKKDGNFFNTLFLFCDNKILHKQSKHKLFTLNDENRYFKAGKCEDIKIFEVGKLKVAALICFELRFIELWQQIRGADVILVPAFWGVKRKRNFEILTQALALSNQCFVICCDSFNEEATKSSAIITPFGEYYKDETKQKISQKIDLKEIKKIRRYLNIGVK